MAPKNGYKQLAIIPGSHGADDDAEPAIRLIRSLIKEVAPLPEEIVLGGTGSPSSVTIGSASVCNAVLPLQFVSRVQMQLALRKFCLPPPEALEGRTDGEVTVDGTTTFRALFVKDPSEKQKVLINGSNPPGPWTWVQDGDVLGIQFLEDGKMKRLDFYQVKYLRKEIIYQKPNDPLADQAPNNKRKAAPKKGAQKVTFDQSINGQVIDVTYKDEKKVRKFRMRIVHYDATTGIHLCDSSGLTPPWDNLWEGDTFTDELKIGEMYEKGCIHFVEDEEEDEKPVVSTKGPAVKRAAKKAKT